ncbi:VOC family protein [Streptomyces sp. DT24]|uniref:VOC family protein n=1 Tax=Streptomyces sp. DT24 TaxID=3416520 RepID=UPI003CFA7611
MGPGRVPLRPGRDGPGLSFLQVPEPKVAKNRLRMDVRVGGGRDTPWEVRWSRVVEAVERLTAGGASVVREDELRGIPDHVVMADPNTPDYQFGAYAHVNTNDRALHGTWPNGAGEAIGLGRRPVAGIPRGSRRDQGLCRPVWRQRAVDTLAIARKAPYGLLSSRYE